MKIDSKELVGQFKPYRITIDVHTEMDEQQLNRIFKVAIRHFSCNKPENTIANKLLEHVDENPRRAV